MNVIIKIEGREAIPVRALPLLAKWGTMHPQKIAGALGRLTDDEGRPLFDNLHDMNAFYVEAGTVNLLEAHYWSDHIYRKLQALSDTIKRSEITHETAHSEWRVKALGVLPKDAFVWKDEYELIYDGTYGIGSRTRESGDAHTPPVMSKGKRPVELDFNPLVDDEMKLLVQDALDAIGRAKNDVPVNVGEQQSSETNTPQRVELVPPGPAVAPARDGPAPLTTSQIASCFNGFHGWDFDHWRSNLQTPAPWLKKCQHRAGNQGKPVIESTWWPIEIAKALDKKHPKIRSKLHARFKIQLPLKPWIESIESHLPDES